eukprot:1642160-Pyramimonas_sp.AAC.1
MHLATIRTAGPRMGREDLPSETSQRRPAQTKTSDFLREHGLTNQLLPFSATRATGLPSRVVNA